MPAPERLEQAAGQVKLPLVKPVLPEVAAQERLLRLTLPDAHLTVAQETCRKARHGRYEVRTLWTLNSAALNGYAGSAGTAAKPWPGLAQVSRIERVVCQRDKTGNWETTAELAYSITSRSAERAGAAELLKCWRAHWEVEALHWVRDVTFGEDGSQIHTGQVPEAFSVLRNVATTLLRLTGFPSIAAGMRELQVRPMGVVELFHTVASRVTAGQGSTLHPANQPCPASRGRSTDRSVSQSSARACHPT